MYDRPFASVPTRKPRTPMEVPMPDLDRFSRMGPIFRLLRKRHVIRSKTTSFERGTGKPTDSIGYAG